MTEPISQNEGSNIDDGMADLVSIASGMKSFENLDEAQIEKILNAEKESANEEKDSQALKANKDEEYRAKIGLKKSQYISKIKEDLIDIDSLSMIEALLFKLAKEIRAFSEGKFWSMEQAYNNEIRNFKKNIINTYYEADTNLILKFWYKITGKYQNKLEEHDPFKKLSFIPKLNDNKKWGSTIMDSQSSPWFYLLFGFRPSQSKSLTIENSHFFSLSQLVQGILSNLEEIFTLKNSITKPFHHRNTISSDNYLYSYIIDKTLPVLKIFRIIEHLSFQNQGPGLNTQHIIYFISWVKQEWFEFLENSLYSDQQIREDDIEFSSSSLNNYFDEALDKFSSRVQNENDFDLDLVLTERKAIVHRINLYRQIIPEIGRRLEYLKSHLLGDILFHFFKDKDLHFSYDIDDNGIIQIKSMERWIGSKDIIVKEQKQLNQSFKKQMKEINKEKVSTNEYYNIVRKAGDFIIILTSLATAFNENFSMENRFRLTKEGDEAKYNYLKENPYFESLSNMASFEDLKKLQNTYDMIFQIKKIAILLDQESKSEIPEQEILSKAKTLKGALENLITLIQNSSNSLEKISQNKEKFDKYHSLHKQLENNFKDYSNLLKE